MDKLKKAAEEMILISFFACFFFGFLYLAWHSKDFGAKAIAFALSVLFAKSVVLRFCCLVGLMKRHKAHIVSYKITAFCVLPIVVIAVLAHFL